MRKIAKCGKFLDRCGIIYYNNNINKAWFSKGKEENASHADRVLKVTHMPFFKLGKTRLPHEKATAHSRAVRIAPPAEVLIPLSQHIGAPAVLTVRVGEEVKVGQKIAEAAGYVSSPIYASVSGTVKRTETVLTPSGKTAEAVRIVSDGRMTPYEGLTPPAAGTFDAFSAAVRESGLVGLGGAGFPTQVKLDAVKRGLIDTVIVNAAECEPYITADTHTMLFESGYVYRGIKLLAEQIPAKEFLIGIEKNKPDAIAKMREIFSSDPKVRVIPLPSSYPQGGEKILIYNTTGRIVPEGKLPADVGALVINITSLAFLAKYFETGMPLVEKCITVDGPAVKEPKNLYVPIGTRVADVLEAAGGTSTPPAKLLLGGPMMGTALCSADDPVLKTTNAVIALDRKSAVLPEPSACIHCGRCAEHCPMHLNPTLYAKAMNVADADDRAARLEDAKLMLCMECGCCSYVCPAKRPLVETNRLAKADLREYKARTAPKG